jgi:hypothetical protein
MPSTSQALSLIPSTAERESEREKRRREERGGIDLILANPKKSFK